MNIAMRKPMTLQEFLAWEDRQELRYEFDGFQPIAMTGGHGSACRDPAEHRLLSYGQTAGQAMPVLWQRA